MLSNWLHGDNLTSVKFARAEHISRHIIGPMTGPAGVSSRVHNQGLTRTETVYILYPYLILGTDNLTALVYLTFYVDSTVHISQAEEALGGTLKGGLGS